MVRWLSVLMVLDTWRTDYFPEYKGMRKKNRDEESLWTGERSFVS